MKSQVNVDVALPKEAYQKLEKVLATHMKAHQADFKEGSLAVAIIGSTVALKNTLTVNYTSSMNGAVLVGICLCVCNKQKKGDHIRNPNFEDHAIPRSTHLLPYIAAWKSFEM